MRRIRWAGRGAAVLALLVVTLAGCGGDGGTGGGAPPYGGAPVSPAPPPAAPATTTPSAGTVVTVEMTEFALALSQDRFTPGTYTFRASNAGQAPHTITINGPGVDNRTAGGPAQAGQEVELTVTLQPGTYEIWCPVGNHRDRGMTTMITVS